MSGHIRDADVLVGVAADIGDADADFFSKALRCLAIAHPPAEVHGHDVVEGADFLQGAHLLALAHIQIDELIGLFHVQSAGNGGQHSDFGGCADKDIFGLAQGRVGHIALLQAAAAGGIQKSFQPGGDARPDTVV